MRRDVSRLRAEHRNCLVVGPAWSAIASALALHRLEDALPDYLRLRRDEFSLRQDEGSVAVVVWTILRVVAARAGSRSLWFFGPVRVQIERWFHLTAMARRAIDQRGSVFESVDVSQEVKNDSVRHFRHVPSDLFGWFIVFFPLAWNMTMGATHAKRPAVTDLHNLQQVPSRNAVQDLDVLEHGFCRLVFLAGNLL
jgi:hypothetical protein